jgi:hypothetical protein
VVLGSHVALHTLTVLRAALVDVVTDKSTADEGDGLDFRGVAKGIDNALTTLRNNAKNSV